MPAAPQTPDAAATHDAREAAPAVSQPRVTHFVAPVYPSGSGDRPAHGRVDLRFKIAADGSVQDIAVLSGADHPQLARAAMTALRQWRFAPGSAQAGHEYRQAIDFDLPEGAESCRVVTGSHICRRDLGDATSGVTIITR